MVPGTWLSGTPDLFLPTGLHHPVMVNHSNKYELNICNFHFFQWCPFHLFIYLSGSENASCSSWFAAMNHRLLCWGPHMLRRSRLLTTAFIVLQQVLWRSSGCTGFNCIRLPGSINLSCNFIGIFSRHPLSSITPPQSVHRTIHQHEEWRWVFKNSVYGSISRNPQGILWHDDIQWILGKRGQKHPPTSPPPSRLFW